MNKENEPVRQIPGVGQPQPEQSRASGSATQPDREQTTDPTKPDLGEAGRGKDPVRGEESKIEWDSRQRRLVVETKRVLEKESISEVMIELAEGEVDVVGTGEVNKPELIVIQRIYADSEPEAKGFYEKNRSGVNVSTGPKSLYVKGESSSGVVSGGSENVPTAGGSSQLPRSETQVVLKVPVTKNVNEGEKIKSYIIRVDSGNIIVENGTGKYDIYAGSGKVVIERCRMEESKIVAGDIEVAGTTFNLCTITTVSGNVETTGTTFNLSRIKTKFGNIEATGIFRGINFVRTESGNILVGFSNDHGEIEVQSVLGGRVIEETIFFKGVKDPNSRKQSILILITEAGEIKVI